MRFLLLIAIILYSCERESDLKFINQSYHGTRVIYYKVVDYIDIDTVSVEFDQSRYEYSGTGYMDYGYGTFTVNGNTITFIDSLGRDTQHTWEWILSGTYFYRSKGDSLYFIDNGEIADISFRLKRM